ncbi:MAG: hypothetical protein HY584_06490 [Candidatus Omnitrophica bacterium]|nr:hypothetical protein [Candidatus Omnitrophota bacterium]
MSVIASEHRVLERRTAAWSSGAAACPGAGRALGVAVPPLVRAPVGRLVLRCRTVGTAYGRYGVRSVRQSERSNPERFRSPRPASPP